jgi:hypothetical protein
MQVEGKDMLFCGSSRCSAKLQGLFLSLILLNGIPGHALDRDKSRQELIEIERRIGEANLNCDYKYFAFIEAPEFKFIGPDGSVTSRAQDLAGEASCKKSASKYEVNDAAVWLDGRTAVVTGRVTIRKADLEVPVSQSRFTDVFVHRDHRWQLVSGHSSHVRQTIPPS